MWLSLSPPAAHLFTSPLPTLPWRRKGSRCRERDSGFSFWAHVGFGPRIGHEASERPWATPWAGARPHFCHSGATPLASDPATPVGSLESTKEAFRPPWSLLCPTAAPAGRPVNACCLAGTTCRPLSVCGSVSSLASPSCGAQTVPTDIGHFTFYINMCYVLNLLRRCHF